MKINQIGSLNISVGIHTTEIVTAGKIPKEVYGNAKWPNESYAAGGYRTAPVNLNKLYTPDGKGYITKFSEYRNCMEDFISRAGYNAYTLNRVDFRLDVMNASFRETRKLNLAVVMLLAEQLNVPNRNCWSNRQMYSGRQNTDKVQTNCYQVEHYDKRLESDGRDAAQARLELRTTNITGRDSDETADEQACFNQWAARLEEIKSNPSMFSALQTKVNRELYENWIESEYSAGSKSDVSRFFIVNQANFFTNGQLVSFLDTIGVSNPETKARGLTTPSRYGFESVTFGKIWLYLELLKRGIEQYLQD